MGKRQIQRELVKQMKAQNLRFTVTDELELEEILDETAEYITWAYERTDGDAAKVTEYLRETKENYPEHIEPIREYIEPECDRNIQTASHPGAELATSFA